MKALFFLLTVSLLSIRLKAQDNCNLIENMDPSLSNVSYQTVFVTVVNGREKVNIKFWKFKNKMAISCFVVTRDTFCVNTSSTVTFNFTDGTKLHFRSDKKQNCRGELNKDYVNNEIPTGAASFNKKVRSIQVAGIRSGKTFTVDEKTAAALLQNFHCIMQKQM